MGWTDLIRFAAQNLWRRRARTLLTTLGVVIGTVCIILLFALGLSSYRQFEEYFLNSDTLTEIQIHSGMGGGTNSTKIDDATLATILTMDGVEAVSPVLQIPVYIDTGEYETRYLSVIAMERNYLADSLEFAEGGMFDDSEMPQLVIGYYAQREFVKDGEEPDDEMMYYMGDGEEQQPDFTLPFDFKAQQLKMYLGYNPDESFMGDGVPASKRYPAAITGTLKKDDGSEGSYNAYISLSAAKRMIQQNRKLAEQWGVASDKYTEARVRAKDLDSVADIVETLNQMGYEAYSQGTYLEEVQKEQASRQSQLVFIGAIALFVSAIGIANTMLTSILERRREIGIMKVTGLAMKKIRRMFLIEASVIGLAGGAIGALLSYIIAFAVNNGSGDAQILGMYFEQGMVLTIPVWLTLAGIGVAVFVGLVAGIYPAWKATKLSPMEAIRGN
jgi:ABC-type antimicrobial peptide transport system permease subunit